MCKGLSYFFCIFMPVFRTYEKQAFFISVFCEDNKCLHIIYKLIVEEKEKMKFVKGLTISMTAALLLAACGGEETKEEEKQQETTASEEASAYPKTFVDGRGVEVIIEEKPDRIVSTTLAVDEYLVNLTDIENIVGVTAISTDPSISNVADLTAPVETKFEKVTAEQVIALDPDLVIIPSYVNPEVLNQLEDAGVVTYQVVDDASFAGIIETVETLGDLLDEEENADKLIADYNERYAAIEEAVAKDEDEDRVLYYTEYLSSVTGNTSIGEMIELAGGTNVVVEAGIVGDEYPDYPNVSKELLVDLNPEFIFTTAWDPSGNEPAFVTEWKNDPALANVDAIKNGHIYVLDSANVTTASHYVIEGAEDMFDILSKN